MDAGAGVVGFGRETGKCGELAGAREAPEIAEFSEDSHGRQPADTKDAIDMVDVALELGNRLEQGSDFFLHAQHIPVELGDTAGLRAAHGDGCSAFFGPVFFRRALFRPRLGGIEPSRADAPAPACAGQTGPVGDQRRSAPVRAHRPCRCGWRGPSSRQRLWRDGD